MGHVCGFKKGLESIDIKNNFKPHYTITKKSVINRLKCLLREVDELIIATDRDREGEAIGYHLTKYLNKDVNNTKRIYFNEITKNALIQAFHKPSKLDLNLFNAQKARSILDLLIGYELSPLLWQYICPKLSAGRCQSPALKLAYEREKDIIEFKENQFYKNIGFFELKLKSKEKIIKTEYYKKLMVDIETLKKELKRLYNIEYKLKLKSESIKITNPSPPYITSSIQQDASTKLNISPKLTMSLLQNLYEKGYITYHRTDSINISNEFNKKCEKMDRIKFGKKYYVDRKFKLKVKDSQEAHECIRPTKLDTDYKFESEKEYKLYNLIEKRTIGSFMTPFKQNEITYQFWNDKDVFTFNLHLLIELGFKKLYCMNNDYLNAIHV